MVICDHHVPDMLSNVFLTIAHAYHIDNNWKGMKLGRLNSSQITLYSKLLSVIGSNCIKCYVTHRIYAQTYVYYMLIYSVIHVFFLYVILYV